MVPSNCKPKNTELGPSNKLKGKMLTSISTTIYDIRSLLCVCFSFITVDATMKNTSIHDPEQGDREADAQPTPPSHYRRLHDCRDQKSLLLVWKSHDSYLQLSIAVRATRSSFLFLIFNNLNKLKMLIKEHLK